MLTGKLHEAIYLIFHEVVQAINILFLPYGN